ncbi:trehalose-6-phosphate synthase [Gregarina niphandrodes]|uniref:Trehalose-6-phosphate synthase n=1 Tax=Gregarina niphandrodes TaxID=110365 RepID=A0A023B2X7_GRENI|nr:trehalose-6-phosphate synthase [Gregarina niphandrodes]EZG55250.1 trehalose-6-phosphate synthase [Gregarina niphandrodes]|eukprot:XP_011131701.1 trehalose-6-phosphate synthase [Gregarina niphandrodes]
MDVAIARLKEIDSLGPFSPDDTVVLVSLELPVRVSRDATTGKFHVAYTNSLLIPGLHKIRRSIGCQVKFIGSCGYYPSGINYSSGNNYSSGMEVDGEIRAAKYTEREKERVAEVLEPFDCYPVFPEESDLNAVLDFCQNTLSPLFHSVIHLETSLQKPFNQELWALYQKINRLWSDTVCRVIEQDTDFVWVHDFHFLLVPQFVSRKHKKVNIGLFLHCPFPSDDLFRCLPVRNEILRSILCADLVGFHFFEYARHFLTACKKLMGLEHRFNLGGFICIEYNGRQVHVKIGHVNVQYKGMQQQLKDDLEIQKITTKFKDAHKNKFIFLSIDRCDHLAGIKMKLQSYRHYLEHFPYAKGNVTLVQYAYPPRHTNEATIIFQKELLEITDDINREFGQGSLVLHIRPIKQKEKWAALECAHCLLDASIRDGLNLIAFEYIACRGAAPGHIILSEFTGCSSTLTCCQRIHPWQPDDVASKMDLCYSTPAANYAEQWARDVAYLSANSLEAWASDFLSDLRRARKSDGRVYMRCGFASTYRILSLDENFRALPLQRVVKAYRAASQKRLLFFDHEGTLAPDRRHIAATPYGAELTANGARPSPSVLQALRALCADTRNVVFVFSGRPKAALEDWFGHIPGIGLCAEHGFYIRSPQHTQNLWQSMREEDLTWKELALTLMQHYVKRTQGSLIENKGSALVFQYRNCDPDFGAWQAKELATYLEEFLFGMPVVVMSGKGYVEARVAGVSKGVACQWVMEQTGGVQFALAIGDDRSDEEMYVALSKFYAAGENERKGNLGSRETPRETGLGLGISGSRLNAKESAEEAEEAPVLTPSPAAAHDLFRLTQTTSTRHVVQEGVFCVTVGKKPSHAQWYVNDTDEVSELLDALISDHRKDINVQLFLPEPGTNLLSSGF